MTRRGFKKCKICKTPHAHIELKRGMCFDCRAKRSVRPQDARPFCNGVDIRGLDAFLRLPVIR